MREYTPPVSVCMCALVGEYAVNFSGIAWMLHIRQPTPHDTMAVMVNASICVCACSPLKCVHAENVRCAHCVQHTCVVMASKYIHPDRIVCEFCSEWLYICSHIGNRWFDIFSVCQTSSVHRIEHIFPYIYVEKLSAAYLCMRERERSRDSFVHDGKIGVCGLVFLLLIATGKITRPRERALWSVADLLSQNISKHRQHTELVVMGRFFLSRIKCANCFGSTTFDEI